MSKLGREFSKRSHHTSHHTETRSFPIDFYAVQDYLRGRRTARLPGHPSASYPHFAFSGGEGISVSPEHQAPIRASDRDEWFWCSLGAPIHFQSRFFSAISSRRLSANRDVLHR